MKLWLDMYPTMSLVTHDWELPLRSFSGGSRKILQGQPDKTNTIVTSWLLS